MRLTFFSYLIFTILAVLPVYVVGAHSLGESLEKEVDGYLIDIGYSTTELIANSAVVFEFNLLNENDEFVDYSNVWLRIIKDDRTILATGIHNAEFGGARITYTFAESGAYEFSARYEKGIDSIAEATFPIEVLPNPSEGSGSVNIIFLGVVGILGIGVGAITTRLLK